MGDLDVNQILSGTTQSGTQQETSQDAINSLSQSGFFQGMSMGGLIAGIVISFVGMAYLRYGKQSGKFVAIFCGIIMIVFPYFVYNLTYLIIIFIILCVLPFIIKS